MRLLATLLPLVLLSIALIMGRSEQDATGLIDKRASKQRVSPKAFVPSFATSPFPTTPSLTQGLVCRQIDCAGCDFDLKDLASDPPPISGGMEFFQDKPLLDLK